MMPQGVQLVTVLTNKLTFAALDHLSNAAFIVCHRITKEAIAHLPTKVPHLRKLSVFAAFPEHMVMRLSCMPDLEEFYITMNGKESHRPEQGLPCSEAFRIYWQMQQVQRPRHACCFNCNQLQSTLDLKISGSH